jgi:hypothetical protein
LNDDGATVGCQPDCVAARGIELRGGLGHFLARSRGRSRHAPTPGDLDRSRFRLGRARRGHGSCGSGHGVGAGARGPTRGERQHGDRRRDQTRRRPPDASKS